MRAGQPNEDTATSELDPGSGGKPPLMARPRGLKSLLSPAPAWWGDWKEHPHPRAKEDKQAALPPHTSSYDRPPITVMRSPMPDKKGLFWYSLTRKEDKGRSRPAALEGSEPGLDRGRWTSLAWEVAWLQHSSRADPGGPTGPRLPPDCGAAQRSLPPLRWKHPPPRRAAPPHATARLVTWEKTEAGGRDRGQWGQRVRAASAEPGGWHCAGASDAPRNAPVQHAQLGPSKSQVGLEATETEL